MGTKSMLVLVAAVLVAGLVAAVSWQEKPLVAQAYAVEPAGSSREETPVVQADAVEPRWGDVRAAPSDIAAGRSLWVDTKPDPRNAIIDARVDVGSLKIVGQEIECVVRWPSQPGPLLDFRRDHPDVVLPEGSYAREVSRVQCRPDGPLHYAVQVTMLGPSGRELYRYPVDPAQEKSARESEWAANERERFGMKNVPYSDNWASLACAAVAAKCRGEALAWPPGPDRTPLEYSQRAADLRRAYGAPFVPNCPR